MSAHSKKNKDSSGPPDQYKSVSLFSVTPDEPLPFSVSIYYKGQFIAYRNKGQVFEVSKYNRFIYKQISKIYILEDEIKVYNNYIKKKEQEEEARMKDSNLTVEEEINIKTVRQIDVVTRNLFISMNDSSLEKNAVEVVNTAKEAVEKVCSKPYMRIFEAIPEKSNTVISHSIRVSLMATFLAYQLGFVNQLQLEHIAAAGILHDVGKTKLPLSDNLELTEEEESEIMRRHPEVSCEILGKIPQIPEEVLRIIIEHHENRDGSGYPKGLRGLKMDGLSRVFVIANSFDNLISTLPGDRDQRYNKAAEIMKTKQRHHFDPSLLTRATNLLVGQGRFK